MKNTTIFFSIVFAFAILTFGSCKKDEPTPEPTKSELLTSGNWTGIRAESYEENILESTEIINEDVFEFNTNGSGSHYYQGSVDETFQWSFNVDKSTIYFDFGNSDIWAVNIDQLTSTKLTLSETYDIQGIEYKDIYYFGK